MVPNRLSFNVCVQKLAAVASKHKKVVAVVSSRNVPSIRAGFAELTLSALENPDDMASTRGGQVRTQTQIQTKSF